jgi:hypothetical protein
MLGWVDPRAGLDAVTKKKKKKDVPAENRIPVVHTDWATLILNQRFSKVCHTLTDSLHCIYVKHCPLGYI